MHPAEKKQNTFSTVKMARSLEKNGCTVTTAAHPLDIKKVASPMNAPRTAFEPFISR
jgi:hypothetical protein